MNAQFFALAFIAALNVKLLAIDLLLIAGRQVGPHRQDQVTPASVSGAIVPVYGA